VLFVRASMPSTKAEIYNTSRCDSPILKTVACKRNLKGYPRMASNADGITPTTYRYQNAELNESHGYLLPKVMAVLDRITREKPDARRIFELGCGNGSVANALTGSGFAVVGIDASSQGIAQANQRFPALRLAQGSAYDDLAKQFGTFPVVLSLEVVEHLYYPRKYAANLFALTEPGGRAIVSTPYHGYWKNLAMAIAGKMDAHFTALWDDGHIKFWSQKTLRALLMEAGFGEVEFTSAGRIPVLAKSMIAIARK